MLDRRHPDHRPFRKVIPPQFGWDAQKAAAPWSSVEGPQMCFSTRVCGVLHHTIDRRGLHTTVEKVAAVKLDPTPKNRHELRSFLGLLHYYVKFIPNLATLLHPLNELLQTGNRVGLQIVSRHLIAAKERLSQAPILAYYDPSMPLWMASDTSAYDLGAVFCMCTQMKQRGQ